MKKVTVILFFIATVIFGEEAYIASFNTLHLGWSKNKDYESMAEFITFLIW